MQDLIGTTLGHYRIVEQIGEAILHSERALELDPLNAKHLGFYGIVLCFDRRFDDAMAAAQTALAIQPDMPVARSALFYSRYAMGMHDELLADQRERIAHDPERVAVIERGLAEGGYEGVQRHLADYWAARYGKPGGTRAMNIARLYVRAGDKDRALEFLEKAFDEHDPNLPYLGLPLWDPLRSDPRFQDLLRRMNLPED